jgi:hypothetical protein
MPLFPTRPSADQSIVQARRSTTFTLAAAFADIDLDVVDIENDTSVIEHTAADQITVKATGNYEISYGCTAPAAATTTSVRVLKNDVSVLSGSQAFTTTTGTDAENISRQFIASLATSDFITLQANSSAGTPDIAAGITLTIVHLAGQKGEQGAASATDIDAVHVNVGSEISGIAEKLVPAANDMLIIEDSGAGSIKKMLKIGNLPGGISLSDTAPVDVTTAAASSGIAANASRRDHKHNVATAAPDPGAIAVGNAASEGASNELSRATHIHAVARGTPVSVGTTNNAGAGTDFAAGNHVHAGLSRNASDFSVFVAKSPAVMTDVLLIEDSTAAGAKKSVTVADLPFVFGRDYQTATSEGVTPTTSSTYAVKTTLTTPVLTGTYRVNYYCELMTPTANRRCQARLYNVTNVSELCSTDFIPSTTSVYQFVTGFCDITFTGAAKTITIQFASQNNVATVNIRRARIEIWRES